jgi:transcriptional regulator with XRE-family HTH domain
LSYSRFVAASTETFSERLARLVSDAGISVTEVAAILGVSENQARRAMDGETASLKFIPALRLCKKLGVSPWTLAGESEPMRIVDSADAGAVSPDLTSLVEWLTAEYERTRKRVDALARQVKLAQGAPAHPKPRKGKRKSPQAS